MTNQIYDVVIIGASLAGIDAYNAIRKDKNLKILVISKNFNKVASRHSVLKNDRLVATVAYLSYNHGLILATLADNSLICSKKVVIATGSEPQKLEFFKNVPDVYYKPVELKLKNKDMPIVIVGSNKQAANYALELAKKYNYIYLCSPEQTIHCGRETGLEIYKNNNIVFLPLCNIVNYKINNNGRLTEVLLDTYEHIKCGAILLATNKVPDVSYVGNSLVEYSKDGYIKTKTDFKTTKIPNLFAIGECRQNATENDGKEVVKYLLD